MARPANVKVVWTYSDYRSLPDDRNRYEVIDGDLYVTPSPTTAHQKASKRIQMLLMTQIEERGLGVVFAAPLDVILSDTRVVQPDLVAVRREREGIVTERGIEGPPDLVVEILSPSTEKTDREAKAKLYASVGVPEYWIVDVAAHTIEVLELDVAGYRLRARHGPGGRVASTVFELDVDIDRVFR